MKTPKTTLYVDVSIAKIHYQCPHCKKIVSYPTDSIPETCANCFQPIKFKVEIDSGVWN